MARFIQLELNEISSDVINQLTAEGELPNFQKLKKDFVECRTTSETVYEHIEPWIQWVTAHTGRSFDEHKIFRLGDSGKLTYPQIWETLSQSGKPCAVIGAMNAKRGSLKEGVFFPDPWSKVNDSYPEELQPLWQLISSKVQAHAVSNPTLSDMIQAGMVALKYGVPLTLCIRIALQIIRQRFDRRLAWRTAALFDEMQAYIFLKIIKKNRDLRFCSLFLNAIAHYQHHYWRNFNKDIFKNDVTAPDCRPQDNPILEGYRSYDRILGLVMAHIDLSKDTLVVLSGLSQVPYTLMESQGGMNYYRLKDHKAFALNLGLRGIDVYPMMSRDWQISSNDLGALENAREHLGKIDVNGEPVFSVTRNGEHSYFIETKLTRAVGRDETMSIDGKPIEKFTDVFQNIAIKSGHHTGIGCLWTNNRKVFAEDSPKAIALKSVFDWPMKVLC
jgi:hypothetical protein